MGWEVTIEGDAAALRWLVRSTAQVSPRVLAVDAAHWLSWDGLEAMGLEHHREVEAAALQHLVSLAGLASVLLVRHAQLRLTQIDFRRPDGGRNLFMSIHETIRVSATVEAELTVLGPDGHPKRVPAFDPIPTLIALAATDETVAKVLRLSSGDLEDWTPLYRLYEVLQDATGGPAGLAALGGVSREQLKVFTGTANSPALSGDASRHGVQSGSVPSKAMALPEAVQLIRQLSRAWLVSRVAP